MVLTCRVMRCIVRYILGEIALSGRLFSVGRFFLILVNSIFTSGLVMVFSCAKKLKGQRHADSEQLPSQLFQRAALTRKKRGSHLKKCPPWLPKACAGLPRYHLPSAMTTTAGSIKGNSRPDSCAFYTTNPLQSPRYYPPPHFADEES